MPVGKALLGRVVDALGNPIDGKGPIDAKEFYPVEKIAPGIIERKSVTQPLQTGIMAIDAMIPIGRGQRELIIGDRATGKTTIAIDTIINQANINKAASKARTEFPPALLHLRRRRPEELQHRPHHRGPRGRRRPATTPSSSPPRPPTTPPTSTSPRSPAPPWANGSWTTAWTPSSSTTISPSTPSPTARSRSSSSAPPAAKRIPGDVFYLHSRLLERARPPRDGNGSLTALPIIETQAGDVSAYIPTNVISITDGQIYLETDLFYQGIRPAISVGLSVSRVGSAAQIKAMKQVAGKIKGELAQFRELAAFAQFGSDLDAKTKAQLDRGARIVELFKQPAFSPLPIELQVAVLLAMQNGFFDPVDVKKVVEAASSLKSFFTTRKDDLLTEIRTKAALDKDLEAKLLAACEEWKASYSA